MTCKKKLRELVILGYFRLEGINTDCFTSYSNLSKLGLEGTDIGTKGLRYIPNPGLMRELRIVYTRFDKIGLFLLLCTGLKKLSLYNSKDTLTIDDLHKIPNKLQVEELFLDSSLKEQKDLIHSLFPNAAKKMIGFIDY